MKLLLVLTGAVIGSGSPADGGGAFRPRPRPTPPPKKNSRMMSDDELHDLISASYQYTEEGEGYIENHAYLRAVVGVARTVYGASKFDRIESMTAEGLSRLTDKIDGIKAYNDVGLASWENDPVIEEALGWVDGFPTAIMHAEGLDQSLLAISPYISTEELIHGTALKLIRLSQTLMEQLRKKMPLLQAAPRMMLNEWRNLDRDADSVFKILCSSSLQKVNVDLINMAVHHPHIVSYLTEVDLDRMMGIFVPKSVRKHVVDAMKSDHQVQLRPYLIAPLNETKLATVIEKLPQLRHIGKEPAFNMTIADVESFRKVLQSLKKDPVIPQYMRTAIIADMYICLISYMKGAFQRWNKDFTYRLTTLVASRSSTTETETERPEDFEYE